MFGHTLMSMSSRWFFQKLKFWTFDPQLLWTCELSCEGIPTLSPDLWPPSFQEPTCFRVVVWGSKMTKGTSSFGKRRNKTHTICRRCGSVSNFSRPISELIECFRRFRSTSKRRPVLPVVSLQLRLGDTTGRSRWGYMQAGCKDLSWSSSIFPPRPRGGRPLALVAWGPFPSSAG